MEVSLIRTSVLGCLIQQQNFAQSLANLFNIRGGQGNPQHAANELLVCEATLNGQCDKCVARSCATACKNTKTKQWASSDLIWRSKVEQFLDLSFAVIPSNPSPPIVPLNLTLFGNYLQAQGKFSFHLRCLLQFPRLGNLNGCLADVVVSTRSCKLWLNLSPELQGRLRKSYRCRYYDRLYG